MKFYGDIPEAHLELIEELVSLENWFKENGDQVPVLSAAKGMVCMAHDYYVMEMEEEGERLLKEAEKAYPGYFKGPILIHIEKDEVFSLLVDGLKSGLALETIASLGFEK